MRIRLDPKPRRDPRQQHTWFAWRPVVAVNVRTKCRELVWLASVYRTGKWCEDSLGGSWAWEYETPVVYYP